MKAPDWANRIAAFEFIRAEALRAVDPRRLVAEAISCQGGILSVGQRRFVIAPGSTMAVAALGKAAAAMTAAAVDLLRAVNTRGLIVAPESPGRLPPRFEFVRGGHPLSDEGSLEAGRRMAKLAHGLKPGDILLALVSGGGSALLELPRPPLTLEDMRQVQETLLHSGADIRIFNLVRSSLSQLKRGGLARAAAPAQTIGLILSDIIANPLQDVASGPTIDEPASPAQARAALVQLSLWEAMPAPVRTLLDEASPPADPIHPAPYNLLIGSSANAADAASEAARRLGFEADVVSLAVSGEAARVGRELAALMIAARERMSERPRPRAMVFAGETTVTVRGRGHGGRNQECALSAAQALAGVEGVALMTLATDGVDGNSDAAGAIVDGETASRLKALGASIDGALRENDSHAPLHAIGACLHTGRSGTNVNDLMIGLVFP